MSILNFSNWSYGFAQYASCGYTTSVKPRTDESLALCHPYLQRRCSFHPQEEPPEEKDDDDDEETVFIGDSVTN